MIALAENLEQRIQALKEQRREAALQEQNTRREQQVIIQIQDESTADRAVPAEKELQRNCSGYGALQFYRVQNAPQNRQKG